MATNSQQSLTDFTAGTGTQTVTQTVVAPLETSNTKTAKVETAVEEFAEMCSYLGDMMASIDAHERRPNNPALYRLLTREFPGEDRTVGSKVALAVTRHVAAAYQSYHSRNDGGERPTFGDETFFMLDNQSFTLVENDRGFGIKANFIPYDPVWFHIEPRPYVREYLDRVVNGDGSAGTAEFRIHDDGGVSLHLPVSWEVDVYEPADVNTTVGVDIGENVIYAAAVVGADGGVNAVEIERGAEFRHYRERLQEKRDRLQAVDDLRGVKRTRDDQRRYTDQVLDTASATIVDLAVEHRPAVIKLEDLTHYRKTASDPIHDWPFAELQSKIAYKAQAEGIPVEAVNPRNTSITCRKCGQTNREYRDGADFECSRCGYEVHADVNAAVNIANCEK
jgi:IS605 OrfB family transposase